MHWKQNFDYRFTGAYELEPGQTVTRKITRTGHEMVKTDRGEERCFVAYFEGQTKPMVLNKTNCKTIEKLYGPQVEGWIGKEIVIASAKVRAFGDTVDALRIKEIRPTSARIDTTKARAALENAATIDELAKTFAGLTIEEKNALVAVKDQMKVKLTNTQQS